jgi:xylulokinase
VSNDFRARARKFEKLLTFFFFLHMIEVLKCTCTNLISGGEKMKYLLGIDLGTSGTKAVLFDESGRAVASSLREYPMEQPRNGWAEQDPLEWWEAAVQTIREVLEQSGVSGKDVAAIGISGQMHGLVMLDAEGEVLRRSIIWCDQRTGRECEEMTAILGRKKLIEITANPALTGFTASKILWVRNNEPEIYARCRHILLPKDYLRYRLTGDFATEVSDASGMQLLDVKGRCWSQEVLDAFRIPREWLGEMYESCEVTGHISTSAAALTGLSADTLVVGGAGDNAAAAVGTGVVREGTAFTTIGTSGVVYAHTDTPQIDPDGRVHTFCCAVPGAWHVMGVTQGAGLSLRWFRDNFCQDICAEAEKQGVDPYLLMDRMAEAVPIGANRLLFLPYLMGERTPHLDPDCRGAFFGISAIHDKAAFIRAVMEGVSFSLRDCYEILKGMGLKPEKMAACGGGGTSPLWRGMLADLYGCPVSTVENREGPALGVAILAGVGAGVYPSVEAGCDTVIREKLRQEPDGSRGAEYEKYYQIYRGLYPALKEQYASLARL